MWATRSGTSANLYFLRWGFITLTVYSATAHKSDKQPNPCKDNLDLAVIGAGISGTYMAWKLKQKHPEWNIALFEATERIGGRTFSVDIPRTDAIKGEFGAMRFTMDHVHLLALLNELNLTYSGFTTVGADERFYYLRGQHLMQDDFKNGNIPYNLRDDEKFKYRLQLLNYLNRMVIDDSIPQNDVFQRRTKDGRLAYNLGVKDIMLEAASYEAIQFMDDSNEFVDVFGANNNYAEVSSTDVFDYPKQDPTFLKVNAGFQTIVKRMAEEFNMISGKGKIYINNKLDAIKTFHKTNKRTKYFKLYFDTNENNKPARDFVHAKRLVLAIPKDALLDLEWDALQKESFQHMLHAVTTVPAVKIVLSYSKPWWKTIGKGPFFEKIKHENVDLKMVITDLPVRQIIDIGYDSSTQKSVVMIYADWWPSVHDWKYLIEGTWSPDIKIKGGHFNGTAALVQVINAQFAQVFNISVDEIPEPAFVAAHTWNESPYWGAWHVYAPGYKYEDVQEALVKPIDGQDLYIVGEAYSDTQGWIEGALRSAKKAIETYF